MANTTDFGSFFRSSRKALGLTLREFCRQNGLDPGNTSKLERGLLPPPQTQEGLKSYAKSLKLGPNSAEWDTFFGLAAAATGRLPEEMLENKQTAQRLPRLLSRLRPQSRGGANWVTARSLEEWAGTKEAPFTLPLLIRRLVWATAKDLQKIEFPAGEQVQRPGWDGIVEAGQVDVFVPAGTSVWEMGVDKSPGTKAERDFSKRKTSAGGIDPVQATYVFVTPRKWQKKEGWRQNKDELKFWNDVRVYDSATLEEWLEKAPAIDAWFAGVIGIKPVGVSSLDEHWANLEELTQPSLKPNVFLASRQKQCEELEAWLKRPASPLVLEAASPAEALDFVAAFGRDPSRIDSLAARTLIVESRDSWKSLSASTETGLNLIAHPTLSVEPELVAEAVRRGHRVLLCSQPRGREQDGTIVLPRIFREEMEKSLEASGVNAELARSRARESGGSITVLKRLMARLPGTARPIWSKPEEAQGLIPMLLAGSWNEGSQADREALKKLSGRPYSEVAALSERWLKSDDPPLTRALNRWSLQSREDSWFLLGPHISPESLRRFKEVSGEVLGEDDPSLKLPPNERWHASLRNVAPRYSTALREGMAETLALLGARPGQLAEGLRLTSPADEVVYKLVENANWIRWGSLSSLLPSIAEASPLILLNAIDQDLSTENPEIYKLFEPDGDAIFGKRPHTGLLWALEILAWEPTYLSRVSLILAQLSEKTDAGTSGNTPLRSLIEIFMPWYPQTKATAEQRVRVLGTVLRRQSEAGWKLLMELLPNQQHISTPIAKPSWRDWALSWSPGASGSEYWHQVSSSAELLVDHAGSSTARLTTLIGSLEHLPSDTQKTLMSNLEALAERTQDEEERRIISDAIQKEILQNKRFANAQWSLDPAALFELERVRLLFEPADPVRKHSWLFKPRWEVSEDLLGKDTKLEISRTAALEEILKVKGWSGILQLIGAVESPMELGMTLGAFDQGEQLSNIVPALVPSADPGTNNFVHGYIHKRLNEGWGWVYGLDTAWWSTEQIGTFLAYLPFERKTWALAEAKGEPVKDWYWRHIWPQFYDAKDFEDARFAISMFLDRAKPECAVCVIRSCFHQKLGIEPGQIFGTLDGLLEVLASGDRQHLAHTFRHDIQEMIQDLQDRVERKEPDVDTSHLARIEWAYLQLLDGRTASPVTLNKQLRDDAGFFVDVLGLIFRPKKSLELEQPEPTKEQQDRARNAYSLLTNWKEIPGSGAKGPVDEVALNGWVTKARSIARERDLLDVCDYRIGHIFAFSPSEPDGLWPCIPVRDVLDDIATEALHSGFSSGIYNKRGIVSKSMREGGAQERELAKAYRAFAEACHLDWPRTAATLLRLAEGYEEEARRADLEALALP
jgi:transcriptional regulator with XRE-family HTH domain